MHETTYSFSNLESPAPGAALAAGRHRLTGWVWPRPGGHFVNVRARVGDRLFPGIHGWPRPDLAAHFGAGPLRAFAGFSVEVDLLPGSPEVVLEVLELEGRWSAFQVVTFPVTGDAPAASAPAGTLRWHDFCRGLDFLLRTRPTRPGLTWEAAAAELAGELPFPQDLLVPPQPFIGHADEPALVNSAKFGRLPVVGYVFHTAGEIRRLWCTSDLHALQPLTLGRRTENLIPHFPQYPVAAVAGYEGYVDVPSQLPNPITLRMYAETPDGAWHLVQVRRTLRHDAALEKHPYVDASAVQFDRALAAWQGALRGRGCVLQEDPEFAPALARLRAGYMPGPKPARAAHRPAAGRPLKKLTLVSHNLNLEGAPLFLLDLARHHAASGLELTVVSAADGVLRERFAATGAKVVILDPGPVFAARDAAEAQAALAALGRAYDFRAADLVIANTFTTFWAVHAAQAAGVRVLSYVHESTSLAAFYGTTLSPAVLALADAALGAADAVSFTSAATRGYHDLPERPIRAVLTPGWVDLAGIDAWLARQERGALRARFGLRPGELLVTNVGTVCDRKGQLNFVLAVDLLNRRFPELAARTRFVLLGGRGTVFDDMLRTVREGLALPNLEVHPETADYLAYYAAADLCACSSHEESSPRVVLETMACGTPLLASDIPGISEMARDGYEATLVPAGDTTAWAEALARLLLSPQIGRDLAVAARARVEADYAAARVLPRHTALANGVVGRR